MVKCSCVRCCVVVFFRILVCLGRVWTLFSFFFQGFGSILAPFGLHFRSFWVPFWFQLGFSVVVAVGLVVAVGVG